MCRAGNLYIVELSFNFCSKPLVIYHLSFNGPIWCCHWNCCTGRVQLKCDGTRWRTGGEVKGKLANGVCSQYSSHYLGTWYPALLPPMRTPRLPVVDGTDASADLNRLVLFAERRNLVSARVPSHFKCSLLLTCNWGRLCGAWLLPEPSNLDRDRYISISIHSNYQLSLEHGTRN